MEVILLKDVERLGKEGETIKVKDGYARNFLIPRKFAVPLSIEAVRILELRKKRKALEEEKKIKAAKELSDKIASSSCTIAVEAGVDDKIFGAVTPEKIKNALRQEGLEIDKKQILIEEPINKLGVFKVEIKLHPEVIASMRIWVVKK